MDQQMQPSSTEEAIPQSPPPQGLTKPGLGATSEEERLQRAFELADAQLEQEASQAGAERRADKGIVQKGIDLWKSAGAGIAKAGFETSDFIFGEPAEEDKTDLRRGIEQRGRELSAESGWNSLSMSTANIVTGLIGAGKIMAPIKAVQKVQAMGKAGRAAVEIAKGAVAGATVMDPHEERLSDLIEQFPDLQNPVTEYLASDPADGAAEGRFKNALEGIGADLALIGAVKAIKWWRMGDVEKAQKEISKLEKARTANREAFGLPEELSRGGEVKPPEQKVPKNAPASVGSGPKIPEDAAPSTGVADEATRSEATTGTHTAPSASGESTTAPASAMPLSEPPRVKAGPLPVEATTEDTATILHRTNADLDALAKYGSREAAAEAGQALTRGNRIPWQKLQTGDEVRAFLANAEEVSRGQMDTAKGGAILDDATVQAKVRQMADYFGEDPETAIGQMVQAGEAASQMVARMEASYLVANAMTQDAFNTATKIRHGILGDWGGDALKAAEELRHQMTAAMSLHASARSMSSNSGRALRRMRGQFKITPEDLAKVKSIDGAQLADILYATKGDPKKLAQAVNPSFLKRVTDEGAFLLSNNLLWLWPTHLMNITSSAMMVLGRPAEKYLGSFAVAPHIGNTLRRQAAKEWGATMAALGDGFTAMVEAFKRGDSLLAPHNTEFFQHGAGSTTLPVIRWKPINTPSDLIENGLNALNYRNLIGIPTRALGAVDEFFKTLRYRAVVQAEAAVEAAERGLTGSTYTAFVSKRLEAAIDPATGRALDDRALREAQIATFQQELTPGTLGATIQQVRGRHPLLHFVVPFVKTPVNVVRYSVKMTPGLNLLQAEYRTALSGAIGPEAQAQAVGQMALGSTFMALTAGLALNGSITGPGPTDHALQRELRATGWQSYSFVLTNEDGSKTYVPLGRADPVGLAFSMVATITEAMQADPEADMEVPITALGVALAKSFTDRTFLANINQAVQAASDPERRGTKWLGNMAGNLIPASSLLRGTNPDPYLREARDLIDNALKNMPGYSETLPPLRDAFGEPILRKIGLLGDQEADAVETEHNRIILETGKRIYTPSPNFEGIDLRDITVRRQNIWRNGHGDLAECRPRSLVDVKRRVCGAASAGVRLSVV